MKAFILQTQTIVGTVGIGIGLNAMITIIMVILKPMILNLNCQKVMFSHYTEAHNKIVSQKDNLSSINYNHPQITLCLNWYQKGY